MSPERLSGQPYGSKADIWSMGLSLFAAASGSYPFQDSATDYWNLVNLLQQPEELNIHCEGWSKEFHSFCECMLKYVLREANTHFKAVFPII